MPSASAVHFKSQQPLFPFAWLMLDRIPVSLSVQLKEPQEDGIVNRFKNSKVFVPKTLHKNYFSLIVASILEDRDPINIIDMHIPEIDGQLFISITVTNGQISRHDHEFVFTYTENMNDEEFDQECDRIRTLLVQKLSKDISKQKTPYSIANAILSAVSSSKDAADLYFIQKDYRNALSEYGGISRQYPELSKRMCEVCRILLGYKPLLEPLAFDILMLSQMHNSLCEISGILPFDAKLAVQYYLTGRDINIKLKVILLYQCSVSFNLCSNGDKAKACYLKLVNAIDGIAAMESHNLSFWLEVLAVLRDDDLIH